MKRFLFCAVYYGILVGCVATPATLQECASFDDVQACEERVVVREDRRYKRAERRIREERQATFCYQAQGGVWDQRTGRCRSGNIW